MTKPLEGRCVFCGFPTVVPWKVKSDPILMCSSQWFLSHNCWMFEHVCTYMGLQLSTICHQDILLSKLIVCFVYKNIPMLDALLDVSHHVVTFETSEDNVNLLIDYTTLHDVFDKVDHNKIILFIKRAGLYKLL